MINAYLDKQAQAGNSLAAGVAILQAAYSQGVPPSSPGVVDMTAAAHEAFETLSQALGDLTQKVMPLVEPYPEPGNGISGQNQMVEASAITGLRVLVERINDKRDEVRRLTSALRV